MRRLYSLDILKRPPPRGAILLFEDCAHFKIIYGRCCNWNVKNLLFRSMHSGCNMPSVTSTPCERKRSRPLPFTCGNGSVVPTTTLGILLLIIRSVQGGVLPKCEQGSNETY